MASVSWYHHINSLFHEATFVTGTRQFQITCLCLFSPHTGVYKAIDHFSFKNLPANIQRIVSRTKFLLRILRDDYAVLEKVEKVEVFAVIMQRLYEKAANILRLLCCQTRFVCWVFTTRSKYVANNYCEQCNSQNIHSIFARYRENAAFP